MFQPSALEVLRTARANCSDCCSCAGHCDNSSSLSLSASLQRTKNAAAHLRRGLAREGNGEHGFRLLNLGEAGEKSLHQQFSFSRTGGSLQHP